MTNLSYPYKPRPLVMLLGGLFFAVCTPVIASNALSNDRGIIIDGLIRLDVGQATLFLWALAIGGLILALGGFFGFVRGLVSKQVLVLDETAVRMPKSIYSSSVIIVAYADITGLTQTQIRSKRFLTIHFGRDGRKVTISSGMLPSRKIFEEVCETIALRAAGQR